MRFILEALKPRKLLRQFLGVDIDPLDPWSIAVSLGAAKRRDFLRIVPGKLTLSVPLPGPVLLEGYWSATLVTLSLPKDLVKWMLPDGLELAAFPWRDKWSADHHPVVLYFGEMFDARLNLGLGAFARDWKPTFSPSTDYREHVVAIPYVRLKPSPFRAGGGEFLFIDRLYLDDLLYTLGGWMLWGFNKRRAAFDLATTPGGGGSYKVKSVRSGEPLAAVQWTPTSPTFEPVIPSDGRIAAGFQNQKDMLDLRVISEQPVAAGPFFTSAVFKKDWRTGRHPAEFRAIDVTALDVAALRPRHGSLNDLVAEAFELRTSWSLSLPTWPPDRRQKSKR